MAKHKTSVAVSLAMPAATSMNKFQLHVLGFVLQNHINPSNMATCHHHVVLWFMIP